MSLTLYRAATSTAAYNEAAAKLGQEWKPLAGPGANVGDRRARLGRDALGDQDGYVYLGFAPSGKTVILVVARDGRYAIYWPERFN